MSLKMLSTVVNLKIKNSGMQKTKVLQLLGDFVPQIRYRGFARVPHMNPTETSDPRPQNKNQTELHNESNSANTNRFTAQMAPSISNPLLTY